jgi:type I restriction enzyme R subunit
MVYSDFEDTIGEAVEVDPGLLPAGHADGVSPAFRDKATSFLLEHLDHPAVVKLHTGAQLTPDDVDALERIFLDSGTADPQQLASAVDDAGGLGLFVRSLIGLDRAAASRLLTQELDQASGRPLTGDQIDFLDLIVTTLTEHGRMPPTRLYESPFTDFGPGPEGLFAEDQIDHIIAALTAFEATARPVVPL